MSGVVAVDLICSEVCVYVFWSFVVDVWFRVDMWVHLGACAEDVEVGDVEDFEVFHEGLGVCSWGDVLDESDDLFLGSDEWLDVCLVGVCCSPDGYCSNEVGEDLAVVDVFECGCGEEFVGVFEALHDGLEFLDDVGDGAVVLEVVLHEDAKELGLICLFEGAVVDMDVKL